MDSERQTVWLAEDNPVEAENARRALAESYAVAVFTDGLSLVERWAEGDPPDALVLDWMLPNMSGVEVCRWLRQNGATQPVFVVTAHNDTEHVVEALAEGATDYITKPYVAGELIARIAGAIRTHQRERRALGAIREQQERANMAEESMQLSQTLLAVMGHDLRTPLQAITIAASILANKPHDEASVRRLAARIDGSARRMATLIDQMLDLTRARLGGGIPIEPRRGDLSAICRAVVEEIVVAYPGRAVRFNGEAPVLGMWDAGRIAQVVTNLCTNALVHGRADGPVEVEVAGGAGGAVLSVANEGAIADDVMPTLFDPFRRSKSSSGLGLGLFIARHIVEAHGGRIDVVRRPGRVSFVVRFGASSPA